jgi:hypothetical protein
MLACLLNAPATDEEWARWGFHHRQSHDRIVEAINAAGGSLTQYQLDPVTKDEDWLDRDQQAHNDFNSALGARGADLTEVDLDDPNQRGAWVWLEHQEHFVAEAALGITS